MSNPSGEGAHSRRGVRTLLAVAIVGCVATTACLIVFAIVAGKRIVAAGRIVGDEQTDSDVEMALLNQLKKEKKLPSIPKSPSLGTDFVILEGVDPSVYGKGFQFRNFGEQTEVWYYMPWWGLSQKDLYRVECFGHYVNGAPELLIGGKYIEMDHVPDYVSKELGYWHEWDVDDKPELRFAKKEPNLYKSLDVNERLNPADGTMIYAFVAATGPNTGKAGAVFIRP